MAWPPNITAGSDGTKYAIEAAGDGTFDLYILQDGLPYLTARKPMSMCRIDYALYDGELTRDEVWAAQIGRGPMSIVVVPSLVTNTQTINGDLAVGNGGGDPTVQPDEIATMQQQSDPFTHTPSHQVVNAMTYVQFWSDVNAGGVMVAECPLDIYRGFSSSIPQNTGSVPPVASS